MSTITIEGVANLLQFNSEGSDCQANAEQWEVHELARIALASLEAEAVGEVVLGEFDDSGCHPDARVVCIAADGQADWENFKNGTRLYTAPPAPVSVPAGYRLQPISEYDAMCAAMLQGAEPVTTAYKLNSPAIPDGWVLVPVEPTAEMLQSGISAHYERSQIQIHDKPAPGPMECAYVAMLAAAPTHSCTNDGWVACSERMPDQYNYDIWVYSPNEGVCHGVAYAGDGEFADDEFQYVIRDASHWMPMVMPAAPQQE